QVTLKKETVGDDGTFSFRVFNNKNFLFTREITTSGNEGKTGTFTVNEGQLTITEANNPAFEFEGAICEGASDADEVPAKRGVRLTVTGGEDVTCTFTNNRLADPKVTIVKEVVDGNANRVSGEDGPFTFTIDIDRTQAVTSPPSILTSNGFGETEIITLPAAGKWVIAEQKAPGYTLTGLKCTDGNNNDLPAGTYEADSNNVKLNAEYGADYRCTFINRRTTANLTLVKTTTGGRDGRFRFTGTDATAFPAPQEITTIGGTGTFGTLTVNEGELTITEEAHAAFAFDSATCTGASNVRENEAERSVKLTVIGGQDVTCTFTNDAIPDPTLTIVKTTEGGDGRFRFRAVGSGLPQRDLPVTTSGGRGTSRTVDIAGPNGLPRNTDGLPQNTTLRITENENDLIREGFETTGVSCVDKNNLDTAVSSAPVRPGRGRFDKSIAFTPILGAAYECTFTNRKVAATLKLVKNVVGDDEPFPFEFKLNGRFFPDNLDRDFEREVTLRTSGGTNNISGVRLGEGIFTITEEAITEGRFVLDTASCTGTEEKFDKNSRQITFNVSGGDDIVCTFTNTRVPDPTLTIVKNLFDAGGQTVTGPRGAATFALKIAGGGNDDPSPPSVSTVNGSGKTRAFKLVADQHVSISEDSDELRANGFASTDLTCLDTNLQNPLRTTFDVRNPPSVGDSHSVSFTPQYGGVYECTFANRRTTAGVTLVKRTTGPAGTDSDGTFSFSVTSGEILLLSQEIKTSGNQGKTGKFTVNEGQLTITEAPNAAFEFSGATCEGASSVQVDPETRSVTLTVTGGVDVTCTFTNDRLADPTLTIIKNTVGGEGIFGFTVTPQGGGQAIPV
ncbi:MAG: prealbumin-like fold domain-containing protein, partial [Hyphomicrobiaceae bacterium]